MSAKLYLILLKLSLFSTLLQASAFTFSFGAPSECDNLQLTWTGGTPPFQLLLIPVFGVPQNVSIPSAAFSNGQGSFSFPVQFPKNTQIMLTMSDATGFNTGGTSNLITVAQSKGGSCNSTEPNLVFSFQLNSAFQQCRPYPITGYDLAQQPVTIGGVIPGGDIVILTPPVGQSFFTWQSNVARGTSMVFFMFDALGRTGGSSDIVNVGSSDDSSCLTDLSPSMTSNPPSATATASTSTSTLTSSISSSGTSTPTLASSSTPQKDNVSIAAIAGTVIGSLLFLAVIITLGLFFLRKRRDSSAAAKRISQRMNSGFDDSSPNLAPPVPRYGAYSGGAISTYPYSSSPNSPNPSNPFLDLPDPSSQYTTTELPSSNATEYTSNRYSSNTLQQSIGGHSAYLPYGQTYPPNFNYPPAQFHPPDPFSPAPPRPTSEPEFDPLSLVQEQGLPRNRNTMSSSQAKATSSSQAPYRPTRFVLHTDVEDDIPGPNEHGIVELPPQYSERRGPPKDNPPLSGKSVGRTLDVP